MKKITAFFTAAVMLLCIGCCHAQGEGEKLRFSLVNDTVDERAEGSKPSGHMVGLSGGGYVRVETIDAETMKKSILVGTGTGNDSNGTYIGLNVKTTSTATIILDVKTKNIINSYTIWLRRTSGGVFTLGNILADSIKLYGGSTQIVTYSQETWYRMKFVFDVSVPCYSVYMTEYENRDAIDECIVAENKPLDAACTAGIENLRFAAPSQESDGYLAIDNIDSYIECDMPQITHFGFDSTDEIDVIKYDASTLCCTLSEPLAQGITLDDISAISENGDKAVFTDIALSTDGKKLTLSNGSPLLSNQIYTFKILAAAKAAIGAPLGKDLTAEFRTGLKQFDLSGIEFEPSEDGSQLKATATVVNSTSSEQKMLIVFTVWHDDLLKEIKLNAHATSEILSYPEATVSFSDMDRVEVYALTSLNKPNLIASKIYKYEN